MDAYKGLVIIGLLMVLMPTAALTFIHRPRPFKYVMRGGSSALCFAFTIDATRRLALIANGAPLSYPGQVWAFINLSLLSVSSLLLWGSVGQWTRHQLRNRNIAKESKAQLEAEGVDVDALIANHKKRK